MGEAEGARALKTPNTFSARVEPTPEGASLRTTVSLRPEGERELLEAVLALMGRLDWLNVADRLNEV